MRGQYGAESVRFLLTSARLFFEDNSNAALFAGQMRMLELVLQ